MQNNKFIYGLAEYSKKGLNFIWKWKWQILIILFMLLAPLPSAKLQEFIDSEGVLKNDGIFYANLIFIYVIGVLLLLNKRLPRLSDVLTVIVMLGVPILSYVMLEGFADGVLALNSVAIVMFNILFVYIIEAVLLLITFSPRFACSLTVLICGLVGFAECMVIQFRSLPIMPWDLLSIGTAMSVAGDYKFQFTEKIVWLLIAFVVLTVAAFLLCRSKIKLKFDIRIKIAVRIVCVLLCIPMLAGYANVAWNEDFRDDVRYYPYLFTPRAVYKYNGFYFSFVSLLKYMTVDAPEGYDAQALQATADNISAEGDDSAGNDDGVKNPNVIVIMNESFSDLSVHGDIGLDMGDTPYIDSLEENTIKGQAYVSVKGGNTPNSEWEFLTGNTMAFLPSGSIPYQQYVRDDTENLLSTLKDKGYKTYSIHPYPASGWDRDTVYPMLGIDESYWSNSFTKNDKIRNYVSDAAVYYKIIRLYHEHLGSEEPFALFCVTMQNHGGFTNFSEFPDQFPSLEEDMDKLPLKMKNKESVAGYSSLVRMSDEALGELIEFFKGEDEPTVILMFGDHQPNSTITKPILSYFGIDEETPDWNVRSDQFIVPFVLWANYDIEEQDGVVTSLNYLNIMLSEAAGFELSAYQSFRKQLQEKYPVITANFCINDRGELFSWDELDMDADADLLLYKQLQYNHSFDTDNTIEGFFD